MCIWYGSHILLFRICHVGHLRTLDTRVLSPFNSVLFLPSSQTQSHFLIETWQKFCVFNWFQQHDEKSGKEKMRGQFKWTKVTLIQQYPISSCSRKKEEEWNKPNILLSESPLIPTISKLWEIWRPWCLTQNSHVFFSLNWKRDKPL